MKTTQHWIDRFYHRDLAREQINEKELVNFITEIQSDVLNATEQSTRDLLECRSTVNELETQLNFWKAKAIELGYPTTN